MNKKGAIEYLRIKLREIPTLAQSRYDNQDYPLWRYQIADVLETVFGRDSREYQRFAEAHPNRPRASSTDRSAEGQWYFDELKMRETVILSIIETHGLLGIGEKPSTIEVPPEDVLRIVPPKAFIAHGGRSGVLDKLREFIEALGLEPLVVELLPSKGMSVDDKVNNYIKDADCGIVLATRGGITDTKSGKPKQHPRLNIIDEVERLRAKFPNRTILLLEKGVELPSNISGLTHESFARQSMDRAFTAIARELREMGILKTEKPPFKE